MRRYLSYTREIAYLQCKDLGCHHICRKSLASLRPQSPSFYDVLQWTSNSFTYSFFHHLFSLHLRASHHLPMDLDELSPSSDELSDEWITRRCSPESNYLSLGFTCPRCSEFSIFLHTEERHFYSLPLNETFYPVPSLCRNCIFSDTSSLSSTLFNLSALPKIKRIPEFYRTRRWRCWSCGTSTIIYIPNCYGQAGCGYKRDSACLVEWGDWVMVEPATGSWYEGTDSESVQG